MQENLNEAKAESCKNRDNTLEELRDYGKKLKDQIDTKISKLEASINGQCDDACSNISSLSTETERITASLLNITDHANQVVSVQDINSLVRIAGKLQKQLEECIRRAENHKVRKEPMFYSNWEKHFALVSYILGPKLPNIINVKSVSKINECRYNEDHISDKVCSLSVSQSFCAMSCTDSSWLCVGSSPKNLFDDFIDVAGMMLICAAEDKVFLSDTEDKVVKVWKKSTGRITDAREFTMHPHGIAHRFNNGHEELLVCFLTDDADLMTAERSDGAVRVLPLDGKKPLYDFIAEASPAPTRVAVSKLDGLVCLSYPSVGKISLRTKDGHFVHSFNRYALGMGPTLFLPYGVCFDNDNCTIIADRNARQVVRVSLFGQVIQTLTKGNRPTAVGVGSDDKLWVGYEDKNVTVFQLTNKYQ